MADSTNPLHQPQTIIEIRPFKGGWQCYEGPGVQPYWTGDMAKEDAIGYAKARAKFGRGEIRVLQQDGSLAQRGVNPAVPGGTGHSPPRGLEACFFSGLDPARPLLTPC